MNYYKFIISVIFGILASVLFKMGVPIWIGMMVVAAILSIFTITKKEFGQNTRNGIISMIISSFVFGLSSTFIMPDSQAGFLNTFIVFSCAGIVFSAPAVLVVILGRSFYQAQKTSKAFN